MKDLRIVFMGTPEFAVATLSAILDAGENVVGVITAPDRPAGRGQKINKSAVKLFAEKHGLNILQPANLKSTEFLAELQALNANLQIVVAFRMLPEQVWKMPQYGTFNLHASLLPGYRGAAPINWVIINGETKTGATTFFIDEKIDTGAVILQEEVEIDKKDNAGNLHDRLMEMGSALVVKTITAIKHGTVKPTTQAEKQQLHTAYKLDRENTKIDWEQPVAKINNLIRGLSPYPVAWTTLYSDGEEGMMKIYSAEPTNGDDIPEGNFSLGSILIKDKKLYISCKDGFLKIHTLQLPGKRKMNVKDLLNGYTFSPTAKVL